MPIIRLTNEGVEFRRRRILISGDPNTRKTSSLLTFPRPMVILSSPGEKGYDTIPTNDPEVTPLIWRFNDGEKIDSHKVVDEVYAESIKAITGGYGKINSFHFDGAHKFFDYILDSVTDGALFAGEEFDAKLYRQAGKQFFDFLSRIMLTAVPLVAITTWAEHEADRKAKPGEQASNIPSHIYPMLPGKAAKQSMGEFSIVVHQTVGKLKPTDVEPQALWQVRPWGDVWGCGLKMETAIAKRIPTFLPANYRVFEQAVDWATAEARKAGETRDSGTRQDIGQGNP